MRRLLVVSAVVALVATTPAQAITFGQPDGNRHPNVGSIVVKLADGSLVPWCSGTMVSERVFLTAAHCITSQTCSSVPGIEFGVTFLSDLGLDDPVPNFDESDLVMGVGHAHPSYDGKYGNSSKRVDVAVIVLEDDPGVGQSDLPAEGLLDTTDLTASPFTTVGYGLARGDKTKGPSSLSARRRASLRGADSLPTE